jgi:thiol-disulfide isomerase/thioredoxin
VTVHPVELGSVAPPVPGVAFGQGPVGLFFYKVTCPTCQMVAPAMSAFERAYPGRVVGVGQDPEDVLEAFGEHHGMGLRSLEDRPPYDVSNAYGIVSVPTLVVVDAEGTVVESIGAWDREGFNRASVTIAAGLGVAAATISTQGDGLPDFKPG